MAGKGPRLTKQQWKFCSEYMVDMNGTQAAIRAGYSAKTARRMGSRLLTLAHIQAALKDFQREFSAGLRITPQRVLREWATIGFACMGDYVEVQADGTAYVDLSRCTREQMAAISEIQVDEYVEGKGEQSRNVKRVRIKFHSKTQALEALSKHLGLFEADNHQKGIEAFLQFLNERAALPPRNYTDAKVVQSRQLDPASGDGAPKMICRSGLCNHTGRGLDRAR